MCVCFEKKEKGKDDFLVRANHNEIFKMPTYGANNFIPCYLVPQTRPHLAPPGLIWQAAELITIAVISAADVTGGTLLKC